MDCLDSLNLFSSLSGYICKLTHMKVPLWQLHSHSKLQSESSGIPVYVNRGYTN